MSNWVVLNKKADFNQIAEQYGISPVTARIIRNRDVVDNNEIYKYLKGTIDDLYDPFLMKDMDVAVELIKKAIADKLKIRVIGDYDADGICSSFILESAFRHMGACVDTAIPHRVKDGYGLNENLIRAAKEDGIECIVTCDNGIAASHQVELAHELGMLVVVTDHHEVPYEIGADGEMEYHIASADAVVDPKRPDDTYPFKGICGAVVAYKLVEALGVPKEFLYTLLEPAAFATICDVMELLDENRIIVKAGIERMKSTSYVGLKALMDVTGIAASQLEAYHIGFVLGPCMNASGRLESAQMALDLWKESDPDKAVKMACELKALNDSRKEMTEAGVGRATLLVEEQISAKGVADKVQVVYLPDIHESLAGIIAGRLREKYDRPVIVLTRGEEGVKGSGRSIEAYDMYAELSKCNALFTKFGGHKMAAGLSLPEENVDTLRKMLNENCTLNDIDFEPKVTIDIAMPISFPTESLIEEFHVLEPFGVGNPKPVFAHKDVRFQKISIIGKNKNVIKAVVLDEYGVKHDLISFLDPEKFMAFLREKHGSNAESILSGVGISELPVSITYYPDINEYKGNRTVQIVMTNYC